ALGMTNAHLSGSFALSTQSVEAKTSGNSSRKARNYLVPPPPPDTPSIVPSALGIAYARAVTADADGAVVEKPVNPHSTQGVQHSPYASYNPGVEKRILKHIDYFDSEISSQEKEIGKLLNL
ncbi:MAG: hypothetical protein KDI30_12490, partial [Pseudomonadales bacterium]|nr:hypothetical protein [Pseudomonadales bacterium]